VELGAQETRSSCMAGTGTVGSVGATAGTSSFIHSLELLRAILASPACPQILSDSLHQF
jgi:hypothetical protein